MIIANLCLKAAREEERRAAAEVTASYDQKLHDLVLFEQHLFTYVFSCSLCPAFLSMRLGADDMQVRLEEERRKWEEAEVWQGCEILDTRKSCVAKQFS